MVPDQWQSWVTFLKDILTIISIVVGAVVAILGINTWRRQLKGQSNLELGKKILKVAYHVRNIIETIRNSRLSAKDAKRMDENPHWKELESAQVELKAIAIEAEALWGNKAKQKTEPISDSIEALKSSIHVYLHSFGQPSSGVSTIIAKEIAVKQSNNDKFEYRLNKQI
ncbi:MAG: hypothetical protein HY258_06820 [Chloroflexi bacterium]|nr:hypothetical protein [Chloroflexota bacterium]